MITFVKLVCPNCGANLEVDSKLSQCFCQYCGVKILLHNENEHSVSADIKVNLNASINQTSRYIDEAGLSFQENERRRIEFEKKKYENKLKRERLSEQREPRTWKEVGCVFLSIPLALSSVRLIFYAFYGITNGVFLDFILSLVCIADLIALAYSYFSLFGKLKLKPSYGIAGVAISMIIFALMFRYFEPFIKPTS